MICLKLQVSLLVRHVAIASEFRRFSRNVKLQEACGGFDPMLGRVLDGLHEKTLIWVVVSNIFYFHPYLGKIPNLTNIFQMGWNHQLVMAGSRTPW